QTNTNSGALQIVVERVVLSVRTVGVQVGTLGQIVGVTQREDVHVLVLTSAVQLVVAGVNHLPRTEQLAGAADRSAQANHVRIGLEAVGNPRAVEAQVSVAIHAPRAEPAIGGAGVSQRQL